MTQANTGRIFFRSDKSPSGPLQVALGNFPTSGVKNVLFRNVGDSTVYARGRANTTATSPDISLMAKHGGVISLIGTAGQPAYIEFWKKFDPRFVNIHDTSATVDEKPGVVEIEGIQG